MIDEVSNLLNRGTSEVIVREDLEKKLRGKRKLRIKLGIDPTGSVLHLGHAVVLNKLREFQELGHKVIFLIGDFTARIGDPTGRSTERPPLSDAEINANMQHYTAQAGLLLDMKRVEVRYNSEWLGKLNFKDIIVLASKVTYAQVAQRADFKERIKNDVDLSLQEFLYPVMQGYDSVALKADVEIGGTDQKFNLLMGRQIQERYDQEPQNVLTCPILEGLDGVQKMSKSLNNYIALTDNPNEMFGKIMSIPDELIKRYFELATNVSALEIEQISKDLEGGINPRDLKIKLAKEIITRYYNEKKALEAKQEFIQVFSQNQAPTDIPEMKFRVVEMPIINLLIEAKLVSSKGEARRLIEGGGVRFDGEKIIKFDQIIPFLPDGNVIQIGKRRFLKVKSV